MADTAGPLCSRVWDPLLAFVDVDLGGVTGGLTVARFRSGMSTFGGRMLTIFLSARGTGLRIRFLFLDEGAFDLAGGAGDSLGPKDPINRTEITLGSWDSEAAT
jgi:hypothetical protein